MSEHEREVAAMLAEIKADCAIVVYPVGKQSGCKWYGLSPERCAEMLYAVADEIVRQRIPLPDKKQH